MTPSATRAGRSPLPHGNPFFEDELKCPLQQVIPESHKFEVTITEPTKKQGGKTIVVTQAMILELAADYQSAGMMIKAAFQRR